MAGSDVFTEPKSNRVDTRSDSIERLTVKRLQQLVLNGCFHRACRAIVRTAVLEYPLLPGAIQSATNLLFGYLLCGWEDTICKPRAKGANIRRYRLCSIDWIPTQRARRTLIQGVYLLHLLAR